MSKATDYIIVTGWCNAYFTKKTKRVTNVMSEDRRVITDNEIIGLFEFYLRKWYETHGKDEVLEITNEAGVRIFTAKLIDNEEVHD